MGWEAPGCFQRRELLQEAERALSAFDEVGGYVAASQIGKWTSDQRVTLSQLTRNITVMPRSEWAHSDSDKKYWAANQLYKTTLMFVRAGNTWVYSEAGAVTYDLFYSVFCFHPCRLMLREEPPSAPPKNIVASGRTNQSIMVQWQPPPEPQLNGVLRGYVLR